MDARRPRAEPRKVQLTPELLQPAAGDQPDVSYSCAGGGIGKQITPTLRNPFRA
jgi:hypothetical protein